MLRSILLALEDSEDTQAAMELALRWASRHACQLIGVGIVDEPGILKGDVLPPGNTEFKHRRDESVLLQARNRIRSLLSELESRAHAKGVVVEPMEVVGDPLERILRLAQRVDLVVLGLRANLHFATRESDEGSLACVIRDSPRPVVAVPATDPGIDDSVLVAYDGSVQAARALAAFVSTNLGASSRVHLICVNPDDSARRESVDLATTYLRSHEITPVDVGPSPDLDTARVILEAAEELSAGMIVMGAYGQPRLREFFIGSVTRTILGSSRIPLLLDH